MRTILLAVHIFVALFSAHVWAENPRCPSPDIIRGYLLKFPRTILEANENQRLLKASFLAATGTSELKFLNVLSSASNKNDLTNTPRDIVEEINNRPSAFCTYRLIYGTNVEAPTYIGFALQDLPYALKISESSLYSENATAAMRDVSTKPRCTHRVHPFENAFMMTINSPAAAGALPVVHYLVPPAVLRSQEAFEQYVKKSESTCAKIELRTSTLPQSSDPLGLSTLSQPNINVPQEQPLPVLTPQPSAPVDVKTLPFYRQNAIIAESELSRMSLCSYLVRPSTRAIGSYVLVTKRSERWQLEVSQAGTNFPPYENVSLEPKDLLSREALQAVIDEAMTRCQQYENERK